MPVSFLCVFEARWRLCWCFFFVSLSLYLIWSWSINCTYLSPINACSNWLYFSKQTQMNREMIVNRNYIWRHTKNWADCGFFPFWRKTISENGIQNWKSNQGENIKVITFWLNNESTHMLFAFSEIISILPLKGRNRNQRINKYHSKISRIIESHLSVCIQNAKWRRGTSFVWLCFG